MEHAAYDSPNRNLLDKNTRQMLKWWWIYAIIPIMYIGIIAMAIPRIPREIERLREYEAFLANSVQGEGTVTHCHRFIGTYVDFDFIPTGSATTEHGAANYYDGRGCTLYPVGATIAIRYLPSDPTRSEGLDQRNLERESLNTSLFGISVQLICVMFWGWMAIRFWRLRYRGQLRQGRLVRSIRLLGDALVMVFYQVPDDDGKWHLGYQGMRGTTLDPAAQKGSPIAVLYAGKHTHMPVRSLV